MPAKPPRFPLAITNAASTVPTLITAAGKACDGEFALVMRPTAERAVLVHAANKSEAMVWEQAGNDAPVRPSRSVPMTEAVERIQAMRKLDAPGGGPAVLRAAWRGVLLCEDGVPQLILYRKIATYGTLVLVSTAAGYWTWHYVGKLQWFAPAAESEHVGPYDTLAAAIRAGVEGAVSGPIAAACQIRDTRRRGALDLEFGAARPATLAQPAPPKVDKAERFVRRHGGLPDEPAADAQPEAVLSEALPPAPGSMDGMMDLAETTQAEAAKIIANAPAWMARAVDDDPPDLAGAAARLDGLGLTTAASRLRDGFEFYPEDLRLRPDVWGPSASAASWDEFIAQAQDGIYAEPELDPMRDSAGLDILRDLTAHVVGTPYILARVRNLVRHAASLASSPRCVGEEANEARQAMQTAIGEYERAARAMQGGMHQATLVDSIRRSAEHAALAAAKAMRSCGAGQRTITGEVARKAAPAPERPMDRKILPAPAAEPPAPLSTWEQRPWSHERVLVGFQHDQDAHDQVADALHRIAAEGWQVVGMQTDAIGRISLHLIHPANRASTQVGVNLDRPGGKLLVLRSSMHGPATPLSWVPPLPAREAAVKAPAPDADKDARLEALLLQAVQAAMRGGV